MNILHHIKYWNDVPNLPIWDKETGEMIFDTGYTRQYCETVLDPKDEDYASRIATIQGYCGDDYTITEIWQEVGQLEQIRADIDYIAMMTGVDLDV